MQDLPKVQVNYALSGTSDGSYRVHWRLQNEELPKVQAVLKILHFQKRVTIRIGFSGGSKLLNT